MLRLSELQSTWKKLSLYERFEQVIIRILIVFISLIIIDALVLVSVRLFNDFQQGIYVTEGVLLQDIFGPILTILILLEFNHSVVLALKNKSNIIQAKTVVLIAILVVARKIILLDFQSTTFESMLGFGAIGIALGVLYWLLRSEHRDMAA